MIFQQLLTKYEEGNLSYQDIIAFVKKLQPQYAQLLRSEYVDWQVNRGISWLLAYSAVADFFKFELRNIKKDSAIKKYLIYIDEKLSKILKLLKQHDRAANLDPIIEELLAYTLSEEVTQDFRYQGLQLKKISDDKDSLYRAVACYLGHGEDITFLRKLVAAKSSAIPVLEFHIIPYAELQFNQELGSGNFGKVHRGLWDTKTVAVKKLYTTQLADTSRQALISEATSMSKLDSEYLVRLYGVCVAPDPYCIVMEYMPRGSLYSLLHSTEQYSWQVSLQIAIDIGNGLAFLHQNKIIHRYLKSSNVLLDAQYRAKICDFGLAKVRQEVTVRSPKPVSANSWIAPELFGLTPKYSFASDIYAYGIILWEILTRETPYKNVVDPNQIQSAVKKGDREEIPATCSATYRSTIESCWSQIPEKRPQALQVVQVLQTEVAANYIDFGPLQDEQSLDDYIAKIATKHQVTRENILMRLLDRPIVILGVNGAIQNIEILTQYPRKEPIFVCYNELRKHYDALLLQQGYNSIDILINILRTNQTVTTEKATVTRSVSQSSPGALLLSSDTLVTPHPGLQFQKVIGDGNCLYHAVTYYLSHGEDVTFLRKMVATNLAAHAEQYRDFITLPEGQSLQDYIARIRNTREWAGNLEINILMRLLNRPIVIIGPDGRISNNDEVAQYKDQGEPIFIYYNGEDHFDALILRAGYNSRAILTSIMSNKPTSTATEVTIEELKPLYAGDRGNKSWQGQIYGIIKGLHLPQNLLKKLSSALLQEEYAIQKACLVEASDKCLAKVKELLATDAIKDLLRSQGKSERLSNHLLKASLFLNAALVIHRKKLLQLSEDAYVQRTITTASDIGEQELIERIIQIEKIFLSIIGCRSQPQDSSLYNIEHKKFLEIVVRNPTAFLIGTVDFNKRAELPGYLTLEEAKKIKKIYYNISNQIKLLLNDLMQEAISILGDPPCPYALLCLGSLARQEMTPYSDIELAILLEQDTLENKAYFYNLSVLLAFSLQNLGETAIPKDLFRLGPLESFDDVIKPGCMLDLGGKSPLGRIDQGYDLIQTPEKMATYVTDEAFKLGELLPIEMLNCGYVCGEKALSAKYNQIIMNILTPEIKQKRALTLLNKDLTTFDPMYEPEEEGKLFKVKFDIYRLPNLILDNLALFYNLYTTGTKINFALSGWRKIKYLLNLGILNKQGTKNLLKILSIAAGIRLKVYLNARAQNETFCALFDATGNYSPTTKQHYYEFSQSQLKIFIEVYKVLFPLHEIVSQFVFCQGDFELYHSDIYDNSWTTRGIIANRLCDYKLAKECFKSGRDEPCSTSYFWRKFLRITRGVLIGPQDIHQGLQYQKISEDGDSLYKAVNYYLSGNEDLSVLRSIVATNLQHNIPEYSCFLPLEEQPLEDYIIKISSLHEWVGSLEISILMRLLDRPIVIIGPDKKILNVYEVKLYEEKGEPIFVYYNEEHHYDALLLCKGYNGRAILTEMLHSSNSTKLKQTTSQDEYTLYVRRLPPNDQHKPNFHKPSYILTLDRMFYFDGSRITEISITIEQLNLIKTRLRIIADDDYEKKITDKELRDIRLISQHNPQDLAFIALATLDPCMIPMNLPLKTIKSIIEAVFYGKSLLKMGGPEEAKEAIKQFGDALSLLQQTAVDLPLKAIILDGLGEAYRILKDFIQERINLEMAVQMKKRMYGRNDPKTIKSKINLSIAYGSLGNQQYQIEILEEAVDLLERIYEQNQVKITVALMHLANAYEEYSCDLRKEMLERCLTLQESFYGTRHLCIADTLISLGHIYFHWIINLYTTPELPRDLLQYADSYLLIGGATKQIYYVSNDGVLFNCRCTINQEDLFGKLAIYPTTSPTVQILTKSNKHIIRKGLRNIDTESLSRLLALPHGFVIGTAVDDGGCFFDALAQTLNRIKDTETFTEKSLRLSCYSYYLQFKQQVNSWNAQDKFEGDYTFIQYTKPELNREFNQRASIWGRAHIEGRMLCQQLTIPSIHVIELGLNPENGQHIVTHFIITTAEGEKQMAAVSYDSEIPTIMVSQEQLHYVPILYNEKPLEENQLIQPIKLDRKKRHQLEELITLHRGSLHSGCDLWISTSPLTEQLIQSLQRPTYIFSANTLFYFDGTALSEITISSENFHILKENLKIIIEDSKQPQALSDKQLQDIRLITGHSHHFLSKYHLAKIYLEKALAIQKSFYPGRQPDLTDSIILELIYNKLNLHTQTAFALTNIPEHLATIDINDSISICRNHIQQLTDILELFTLKYGSNHINLVTLLKKIGALYNKIGDYKTETGYLERALRIEELHPESISIAQTFRSLSLAYKELGQDAQQKESAKKALAIAEKFYKAIENPIDLIDFLVTWSFCCSSISDKTSVLERAAKIQEHVYRSGSYPIAASTVWGNLGLAYFEQGKSTEAEHFLNRALIARKTYYGEEHIEVGYILDNLGDLAFGNHDFNLAKDQYELALRLFSNHFGKEDIKVAKISKKLGNTYSKLPDLLKAKENYEFAFNIFLRQRGITNSETQEIFTSLINIIMTIRDQLLQDGITKFLTNCFDESIEVFDHLLNLTQEALAKYNAYNRVNDFSSSCTPPYYSACQYLALANLNLGRYQQAKACWKRFISYLDINKAVLPRKIIEEFLNKAQEELEKIRSSAPLQIEQLKGKVSAIKEKLMLKIQSLKPELQPIRFTDTQEQTSAIFPDYLGLIRELNKCCRDLLEAQRKHEQTRITEYSTALNIIETRFLITILGPNTKFITSTLLVKNLAYILYKNQDNNPDFSKWLLHILNIVLELPDNKQKLDLLIFLSKLDIESTYHEPQHLYDWQRYRNILEKYREELTKETSPTNILTAQINFSAKMQSLTKIMLQECFELLGAPPNKICFLILGSMSQQTMQPYSGFEYALLEKDPNLEYTEKLLLLFEFKIASLGEQDLTRPGESKATGFRLNPDEHPGKVSPFAQRLRGTPQEIIERCQYYWQKELTNFDDYKHLIISYYLLHANYLFGDNELWQEYQNKLTTFLTNSKQQLAKKYLQFHSAEFNAENQQASSINVKKLLIAPLLHLLQDIYLYKTQEHTYTWNILKLLKSLVTQKIIHPIFASDCKRILSLTQFLRYQEQCRLQYQSQTELVPKNKEIEDALALIKATHEAILTTNLTHSLFDPLISKLEIFKQIKKTTQGTDELMRLITNRIYTLSLYQAELSKYQFYYLRLSTKILRATMLSCIEAHEPPSRRQIIWETLARYPNCDGTRPSIEREEQQWLNTLSHLFATNEQNKSQAVLTVAYLDQIQTGPLHQDIYDCLVDITPIPHLKTQSCGGTHLVLPVQIGNNKFHFKFHPENPGYEIAATSLHRLVVGRGASQSVLAKLELLGNSYPILITKTETGKDLSLVLHNEPDNPLTLDAKLYSQLFLITLLLQPEDGKPTNYILQEILIDGKKYTTLVCIDNSRIFVKPFKKTSWHSTEQIFNKTIIYCLEQFGQPLDPEAIEDFLILEPISLLTSWFEKLQIYTTRWNALFNQAETERYANMTGLNQQSLLRLKLAPDLMGILYQQFCTMREILANCKELQTTVTPYELLKRKNKKLAKFYKQLFIKFKTPKQRFAEIIRLHYNKQTTQLGSQKILRYQSTMNPERILTLSFRTRVSFLSLIQETSDTLQISRQELAYIANSYDLLQAKIARLESTNVELIQQEFRFLHQFERPEIEIFISSIVNRLNFARVLPQFHTTILDLLDNILIDTLLLHNCDTLKDELLQTILSKQPNLRILHLEGCSNLNVIKLPLLTNLMTLRIKGCAKLQSIEIPKKATRRTYKLKILTIIECPLMNILRIPIPTWQLQEFIFNNTSYYFKKYKIMIRELFEKYTKSYIDAMLVNMCRELNTSKVVISYELHEKLEEVIKQYLGINKNIQQILSKYLQSKITYDRIKGAYISERLGWSYNDLTFWLQAFQNEDVHIRKLATDKLGRLSQADETIISALINALGNESLDIQVNAAKALRNLGQTDERTISALINALKANIPSISKKIAEILGNIDRVNELILSALLAVIADTSLERLAVREKATETLGKLGKPDEQAIAILHQILNDKSKENLKLRIKAVEALGRLGKPDEQIIIILYSILEDDNKEHLKLRTKAAKALGRLGKPDDKVIAILHQILNDKSKENFKLRANAAEALSKLGRSSDDVTVFLIQAFWNQDYEVYVNTSETPSRLKYKNDKVRISTISKIIMTLRDQNTSEYHEYLLQHLGDINKDIYEKTIKKLIILCQFDTHTIYILIQALEKAYSNTNIPIHIIKILGKLATSNKKAITALLKIAKNKHRSLILRINAAKVLLKLGQTDECLIPVLLQALDSTLYSKIAAKTLANILLPQNYFSNLIRQTIAPDIDYKHQPMSFFGTSKPAITPYIMQNIITQLNLPALSIRQQYQFFSLSRVSKSWDTLFQHPSMHIPRTLKALSSTTMSCQTPTSKQRIPEGLQLQQIIGDGNCLYRAITLYLNNGEDIGFLRNMVADNLQHHPQKYQGFIPLEETQSLEDYIAKIRNTREWAGNVEINILMCLLRRPIVIIGPDGQVRNIDDINHYREEEPIFVYYNGTDHYDALILTGECSGKDILATILASIHRVLVSS